MLFLPLVQQKFELVEVQPLSGAFNLPDTVPLSSENWFSGEYQDKYSPFYEYQIGFRPWFVRLRNQLYYWAYHRSTNYISVGKEDQLYAWNYWSPFWGLDFIGEDSVKARVDRMVQLKNHLDSLGTPMLVVIGANKARINAKLLPDDLQKEERTPNNYRAYLLELSKSNIPVVDFNAVFGDLKAEKGRQLFPNTGTHWSAYGMGLCLDSILTFAQANSSELLRQARVTGAFLADSIVDSDIDLSNDLNLIFPVKRQPNLFPEIQVTEKGRKAKLFVIGDSFYWNLYQLDSFYETVDSSSHYWYYNNTDIAFDGTRNPVGNYDVVTLARKADLVVILATEANLHLMPFEFPEEFLQRMKKVDQ